MDEDRSLCDRATRYVSLMEQLSMNIVSQLASKKDTEKKVLPAQEELKTFILEQSLHQREFTERQSAQQHEFMEYMMKRHQKVADVPIESRSTSVKLPKLELKSFFGDKANWPECWDSLE
ncbi:hypothetical protein DPMN_160855 [Dreissena polymorpha]|nr:hypothetical protein DPMN_160855 [Dreissena polymorpha]